MKICIFAKILSEHFIKIVTVTKKSLVNLSFLKIISNLTCLLFHLLCKCISVTWIFIFAAASRALGIPFIEKASLNLQVFHSVKILFLIFYDAIS